MKPDHVDQLLLKRRTLGQHERLDQMRFESTPGPGSAAPWPADPTRLGHRPATPVRCPDGLSVLGQTHDLLNFLRGEHRCTATTLTHHPELGNPS